MEQPPSPQQQKLNPTNRRKNKKYIRLIRKHGKQEI